MKTFDTFDALPEGANEFMKIATIHAVQICIEFQVHTLEGTHRGKAGDWLAKGANGELYIIDNEIFKKTYAIVRK